MSIHPRTSTTAALACALLLAPTPGAAQSPTPAAAVREVRELQREFERYRMEHTLIDREASSRPDGICDERIGRICIWFGGAEGEAFPAELREVEQARVDLIRALLDVHARVKDRWVLGQLVHYLVENRDIAEAQRIAEECGIAEAWWCSALEGYVLDVWTRYQESEVAFREALDAMPDSVWREWTSPRWIFTPGARERFDAASDGDRARNFELLWTLSDPLFLVNGNDRLTDHLARLVEVENRRDAADPLGLEPGEDLLETLVRYGMNTGYSRRQDLRRMEVGNLQDTRRMVGHHHPMSRGYLFPEEFFESPSDIPPETWITAPREARTWYAPPYAPDIRGLDTQVGRFRRDGDMLVVGAYRPTVPTEDGDRRAPSWDVGATTGEPAAALFLVPVNGADPVFVRGDDPGGVFTLLARPGRYVAGLEVVDLEGRRAWRARQGVVQEPLVPGTVDVSDLMILEEGAPLPESLDDALPHVRPHVRLTRGERFAVLWETYGLRVQEPVRVTIGFSEGRPGFLERVGEFLGIIEPSRPVDVTFEDTGPDRVQSVFRAVELQLPDLDPGEYTLHLRLELTGREPVTTSRPITVVG